MLVDTNIVSYFQKRSPLAALYEVHLLNQKQYISFVTVAELYRWPIERNWGQAKTDGLKLFLRNCTVLPFDDELARTWAELFVGMRNKGMPMDWGDCWIAASALRHRMPLVTHNRRHFENVDGLELISEAVKAE